METFGRGGADINGKTCNTYFYPCADIHTVFQNDCPQPESKVWTAPHIVTITDTRFSSGEDVSAHPFIALPPLPIRESPFTVHFPICRIPQLFLRVTTSDVVWITSDVISIKSDIVSNKSVHAVSAPDETAENGEEKKLILQFVRDRMKKRIFASLNVRARLDLTAGRTDV